MLRKLDYGCGDGGFREIQQDSRLVRNSWLYLYGNERSCGIDIDLRRIKTAKGRIKNGTNFIVADGRSLPFRNDFFDIVHESGALHHMYNYIDGIKEMARVTKKFGELRMKEVPIDNKMYTLFRKMSGNWHGDSVQSWFSESELINELEKYFKIVDIKRYWRSLISDFIAQIGKEPQVSIVYCHVISKSLQFFKLDKYFCCHLVITGVRK